MLSGLEFYFAQNLVPHRRVDVKQIVIPWNIRVGVDRLAGAENEHMKKAFRSHGMPLNKQRVGLLFRNNAVEGVGLVNCGCDRYVSAGSGNAGRVVQPAVRQIDLALERVVVS